MKKILIVILILFTNCSSFIVSEEQKNWCYGQHSKFEDSLVSWVGISGSYYDTPTGHPTEFTKNHVSRSGSTVDIFKNKYDDIYFIEPYLEEVVELNIDTSDTNTKYYFFAKALKLAILDENRDALRYCKIFYEVSN